MKNFEGYKTVDGYIGESGQKVFCFSTNLPVISGIGRLQFFKSLLNVYFYSQLFIIMLFTGGLHAQVPDSGRAKNMWITTEVLNNQFEKQQMQNSRNPFFSFPDELNKKRFAAVMTTDALLVGSSIYALNEAWYKKYDRSAFHLFDDSREWMQMDKLGHLKAAHTITSYCYYSLRWSGLGKKKAALYGGAISLGYMTSLEVLDGYSEHWGFSLPDMTANVLGTAIFVAQTMFLGERRVKLKISYHPTRYAQYRTEVFGDNALERTLKDYNGQTQWLSFSSGLLFPKQEKIPKWLCISIGYGAEGMLGGFSNPKVNDKGEALPHFDRYRQLYLSFDVDFAQIKTKKKWVRGILLALNSIKIPFPALEYSTKGQFKFHYLYF